MLSGRQQVRAGPNKWGCIVLIFGVALCAQRQLIAAPDDDAVALAGADVAGRAAAAARIAESGQCSPEAMRLLIALLADPAHVPRPATSPAASNPVEDRPTVGDRAAEALGRLGRPAVDPLLAALEDPARSHVHGAVVNLLGRIAPARAAPAVLRYVQRHVVARRKWDAGMSVAWLGRDAAPALIRALETDVLELQVVAAGDLGDIGETRALSGLLAVARRLAPLAASMPADYTQRRKIVVFRAAVGSIAKLAGSASFEQIRRWQSGLAGCWDAATSRALILALAHTGDERAAPMLLALLESDDRDDKRAACEALGILAHPATAPGLIGALGGTDAGVRANAATALAALADPAAVEPLIAALTDPAPEVRGCAAAALTQITGVDLGLDPLAWRYWRDQHHRRSAENQPARDKILQQPAAAIDAASSVPQ